MATSWLLTKEDGLSLRHDTHPVRLAQWQAHLDYRTRGSKRRDPVTVHGVAAGAASA